MKTSFVLYTEYLKHMQLLSMEQRGVLFTAIMAYEGEAEMPEMDGAVEMAFSFIKVQLERDEEKYAEVSKKRSEARKAADKGRQGEQIPSPRKDIKQSKSTSYKARQAGAGVYKAEHSVSSIDNGCQTSEEADKVEEVATSDDNGKQSVSTSDKREQRATNGCEYEDEDVDEDGIAYPSSLPQARARKESLSSFLAQNKLVVLDVSPADPSVFDFTELCAAFRESDYLKNRRHEFSWVMRCYEAILRGEYRDNAPVKGRKSKMQAVYTALKAKYEQEEQYAAYN